MPRLETGGAERTTVDVAAALAREGFTPYVATEGGRMIEELETVGGIWIPMQADSKLPHVLALNILRLGHIIRTRNISLVHARSRAPAWSAYYAAHRAGVPFVTTYHGIYNAKSALKRRYNAIMAQGDAVIANSEWTAAHIEAEHAFKPGRLVVIPRGVDIERFTPDAVAAGRIAILRQNWEVRDGETVILLPGRLTRWKGQTVLIEALGELKRAGMLGQVRAVLAGDAQGRDAYENELRDLVVAGGLEDCVIIAGHVADMPAAYLAADIVVSASTDPEAFGRVSAEAGAMERPVIATDHGGAREILVPNKSGILVPPGDAPALARALGAVLALGANERAAMGKAARAHVLEHFTVERMCADTLALYREMLAGGA